MNVLLATPASYVLPSLYLISLALFSKKFTLPISFHGLISILAFTSNLLLNGLGASLRSLALALAVFLFLMITGILSKTGTFALPISLLALPVLSWVAILPGLFLLGMVSIWKIWRSTSKGYLASIALDTLNAIGAIDALNGRVAKPNLSMLPIPNPNEPPILNIEAQAHKIKVNLNLYLGISVMLVGLLAYYRSFS